MYMWYKSEKIEFNILSGIWLGKIVGFKKVIIGNSLLTMLDDFNREISSI